MELSEQEEREKRAYVDHAGTSPAPPTEREEREEEEWDLAVAALDWIEEEEGDDGPDYDDGLAALAERLSDFRDAGGDPTELAIAIEWLIRLFIAQHEIDAHPNLRTHSPEEPADLAPKHDREAILSLIADDARRIEAGEPSVCAGCEKEIASRQHVYRCTECGLPFHLPCARVHFRDSADASPEEPDDVICSTCGERRPRDPVGMRGRPEEPVATEVIESKRCLLVDADDVPDVVFVNGEVFHPIGQPLDTEEE